GRARGRRLPVHAAQARLPGALPLALLVPRRALARPAGRPGRPAPRRAARALLPRLLLDADAPALRGRRDEPRLDARPRRAHGRRAGDQVGPGAVAPARLLAPGVGRPAGRAAGRLTRPAIPGRPDGSSPRR